MHPDFPSAPLRARRPAAPGTAAIPPMARGVAAVILCVLSVLGALPGRVAAQAAPGPAASEAPEAPLRLSTTLPPAPAQSEARDLPSVLRAQQVVSRPQIDIVATGEVELRRAGVVLRADWLQVLLQDDLVKARGQVRVSRQGAVFSGPQLELKMASFQGWFDQPVFDFPLSGAGGSASRIDFLDEKRLSAANARYTSCPRDGSADPAWLLSARRVDFDYAANEGVAQGAVLRFLGWPILALPTLSFPLTDARKSGWLPPSVSLDNRSGIEIGVPYYWNIAPNRDLTLTPRLSTRRGAGLEGEFRYLEPAFGGEVLARVLPHDQVEARSRYALRLRHEGSLRELGLAGTRLEASGERVSDDAWWKDFPRTTAAFTPRLLPLQAGLEHPLSWADGQGIAYARTQRWQVLQSVEAPIAPPYDRTLQLGARLAGSAAGGLSWTLESEFNRFDLSAGSASSTRPTGARAHALASLSRPWSQPGWWVIPRLALNAATYDLDQTLPDGRRQLSRTVPTATLELGLELEREFGAFGRSLRQTLEPRLLAVYTPWRAQSPYLAFDSAGKDFSLSSLFSDNDFSGVDRVSDAQQLNAGFTTRLVDAQSGNELLRLGLLQRYLLADQRITPEGAPYNQRVSDLMVLGSTSVIPNWFIEGSMRYNADIQRPVRTVLTTRYTPGDFRTVSATYRFTRSSSEQLELGVQWPLARLGDAASPALPRGAAAAGGSGGGCSGRLFGVGRVNYSVRDRRVTDSILGLEFDAGCWIGRVVVERLSTGRTEATTRLMLQLELLGLSRLGQNPLQVLKDNIPGYQMLRDERGHSSSAPGSYD